MEANPEFRVIVSGTRTYKDVKAFHEKMDYYFQNKKPTEILSGGAKGTDAMAKEYAYERAIPFSEWHPDWSRYGKQAGPRRNVEMSNNADALIAFWDGKSPGTKSIIDIAKRGYLKIKVVEI